MQEIRRSLELKLPETVMMLSQAFTKAGYQLFVVGGAVRDAVLGVEPKDFDLATNATPQQVQDVIMSLLPQWSADLTGEAFGVIRTSPSREFWDNFNDAIKDICQYEIATFREDISAGRHPEVRFATIKEDVQRRDLTINALFYDIDRHEVVDLVGGLRDIDDGLIRMVGRPADRFAEDRLRIMRAIRFASRFGYMMSEETERAILEDNSLEGISPERIRDEFVRSIATARDSRVLLGTYDYFGLWGKIFPGLKVLTVGLPHMKDPAVVMASILSENKIEDVARVLNTMKYSDAEVKQVTFLIRLRYLKADNAFKLKKAENQARVVEDQIRDYAWMLLCDGATLNAFMKYRPTVKGDDLLAEGYSGRALGVELERRETELFGRLVEA